MKFLTSIINRRTRFPLFVAAFFAPMSWFATHPLDLPAAPKYLAMQLTRLAPQYQVTINSVQLHWDRRTYKPTLLLKEVQIQQGGSMVASLENAAISFSIEGISSFPPRLPIEVYLDNIKLDLDSISRTPPITTTSIEQTPSIGEMLLYMNNLQSFPAGSIVLRNTTVKSKKHESILYNIRITPGKVTRVQVALRPTEQSIDLKIDWRNKGQALAKGKIYDIAKFHATADYDANGLNLMASLGPIKAKDLLNLWPQALAESTKSWLDTNLLSGSIVNTQLKVDVSFENEPKRLKLNNIAANIAVRDATMSYMDGAPKIEHLDADIEVINDTIGIKASSAILHGVPLKDLSAEIRNLASGNAELTLHSKANGPIMPILEIALAHTKNSKVPSYEISGEAETTVDLMIPLSTSAQKVIDVESKLTAVSANNIKDGHSISDGNLLASYKDGVLIIKGKAIIDKTLPAQIVYTVPSEQGAPTRMEISENITTKQLHGLGFQTPSFLKKELALKYILLEGIEGTQRFIEVDSDHIDLNDPTLSMLNLKGSKGKFKTEIIQAIDGSITLKDYNLKTPSLSSKGNIILDKNHSILSITSPNTKFNNSDFSFTYEEQDDKKILTIGGNNFDINNIALGKLIKKSGGSSKPFSLRSSLKKLGMYNGLIINKPELAVECSPTLCTSAILRGKFDNGNSFNISYKYPDFSWYSDNAGDSLRALNIYTKMKGGLLSATAKLPPEGGATKGVIDISNYHLIKTPILTKLLSITAASSISFGGLADLIQGKGIGFKKLKCPIVYAHNLLILDNCMQEGGVINMTAKGTLNLAASTMDVSGVVSPVNFVNSISRRVPILRQFSGGDRVGLIAMSYTMKGEFEKDPQINVNPLSILAPGFLKGGGGSKK